jgi:acetyl-CoA carboxylase biotin carboxyl carrier protein
MNTEQIREYAEVMRENGLTLLEIKDGEAYVRLKREKTSAAFAPRALISARPAEEKDPSVDFNDLTTVVSPLVGVFYASPSPEAEPFVRVGSAVKQGDVLCIVEAMKLMNEITAESDGEIVDVCANNGDVVEFGQVLFKVHGGQL